VLEEVLFISVEVLPVFEILSKVDFFCGPEGSFSCLYISQIS